MHTTTLTPTADPLKWLRGLIRWNVKMSQAFDRLFPAWYAVDGNMDYQRDLAPAFLTQGSHVVDVGGGKQPFLSSAKKQALHMTVTGIDIDAGELGRAPEGAYDTRICADITHYEGTGTADVVICQAVLEHVTDVEAGIRSIVSCLKPGGVAVLFVPSRNAVFARLNLLLPEKLKRWLLYTIYPQSRAGSGFVSYYDRCTLADFSRLAEAAGAPIVESRCYYMSAYLTWCVPLHMAWRCWIVLFKALRGQRAAETFSCVLKKGSGE